MDLPASHEWDAALPLITVSICESTLRDALRNLELRLVANAVCDRDRAMTAAAAAAQRHDEQLDESCSALRRRYDEWAVATTDTLSTLLLVQPELNSCGFDGVSHILACARAARDAATLLRTSTTCGRECASGHRAGGLYVCSGGCDAAEAEFAASVASNLQAAAVESAARITCDKSLIALNDRLALLEASSQTDNTREAATCALLERIARLESSAISCSSSQAACHASNNLLVAQTKRVIALEEAVANGLCRAPMQVAEDIAGNYVVTPITTIMHEAPAAVSTAHAGEVELLRMQVSELARDVAALRAAARPPVNNMPSRAGQQSRHLQSREESEKIGDDESCRNEGGGQRLGLAVTSLPEGQGVGMQLQRKMSLPRILPSRVSQTDALFDASASSPCGPIFRGAPVTPLQGRCIACSPVTSIPMLPFTMSTTATDPTVGANGTTSMQVNTCKHQQARMAHDDASSVTGSSGRMESSVERCLSCGTTSTAFVCTNDAPVSTSDSTRRSIVRRTSSSFSVFKSQREETRDTSGLDSPHADIQLSRATSIGAVSSSRVASKPQSAHAGEVGSAVSAALSRDTGERRIPLPVIDATAGNVDHAMQNEPVGSSVEVDAHRGRLEPPFVNLPRVSRGLQNNGACEVSTPTLQATDDAVGISSSYRRLNNGHVLRPRSMSFASQTPLRSDLRGALNVRAAVIAVEDSAVGMSGARAAEFPTRRSGHRIPGDAVADVWLRSVAAGSTSAVSYSAAPSPVLGMPDELNVRPWTAGCTARRGDERATASGLQHLVRPGSSATARSTLQSPSSGGRHASMSGSVMNVYGVPGVQLSAAG